MIHSPLESQERLLIATWRHDICAQQDLARSVSGVARRQGVQYEYNKTNIFCLHVVSIRFMIVTDRKII